ncbi:TSCPD domain-containing protein [Thioalkalivibrio thiocyanodenitrificans]|uniref:TSCPD domain-containing protein n=1 Tax=Thioalkalivibrio thiocyanodenitrificans TaxID=243063 RepID=UPI00039AC89D|nr:NrdJb [Thioalkalivibrio thiocyanodenitrificans]
MREIAEKIVGFEVKKPEEPKPEAKEEMNERLARPECLKGATYKVKTPLTEHALYVTINDVVLNEGTDHEERYPFEIFVNSKNMEHFQWIVALTRIASAVFRKGGDCTFLVEELKAVFDPKGGYFQKGGRYMPSLVAELGHILETHLQSIGLLEAQGLDEHQKKFIESKLAAAGKSAEPVKGEGESDPALKNARLCPKCNTKAVIRMDGCDTCTACGDSKCG